MGGGPIDLTHYGVDEKGRKDNADRIATTEDVKKAMDKSGFAEKLDSTKKE